MSYGPVSELTRSILWYLECAERNELNPHLRDDLRIAWITVFRAARGEAAAHISACYTALGLHPDKVWPAILTRRKAQLGPMSLAFYPENPCPKSLGELLPPKKPSQSERFPNLKAA